MSKDKPDSAPGRLAAAQRRFAAHIRDPQRHPAPADVDDRRMGIYRELFFNNIRKFLANNFPVLHRLYGDEAWAELVRAFYAEHRAHTPLFPEIPREFLQYLEQRRGDRPGDPPFLLELAHYEWVELALSLDATDLAEVPADQEGDLLERVPVLSPLAWPLSYRYPVHRIQPEFQPTTPPDEPTHLLVYRNRADEVRFMHLNAVAALLAQMLKEDRGETGQDLMTRIAATLEHPDPQSVIEHGRELLEDWRARDIILGTRPTD